MTSLPLSMGFDGHSLANLKETRGNPGFHLPHKYARWQPTVSAHPLHSPWRDPLGMAQPQAAQSPGIVPASPGPKLTHWVWPRPELVTEPTEFHEREEDGKTITQKLPRCTLLPPALAFQPSLGSMCWVCLLGPSHSSERKWGADLSQVTREIRKRKSRRGCFPLAFSLI